ncbi:caprin homolog [Lucilia cuprina]|uniref:caprin homolog n=1 Tax=Lucilia cuprina TaxID=7375 RepID=UPI001F06C59C|nr:caprin homolog [Lucilia cuprina]
MPSASNNNQSNTKLVKQTSVNSVNSGGASGTSGGGTKGSSKKITENITKSNNATTNNSNSTTNNNETSSSSSIKTAKENTNNVVAAAAAANSKNWETSSAAGNASSTTANKDAGNDALNPMKLTFTTIEHKIRNLEKRKTKLEGYRAIQASGKELSSDQKAAVAKYDAVMATLEFARDLVKQMQQFTKDAEKEQKKQARKELIAKAQAETIKIREVLIIQNILSCFTDEAVRNDFLSGENGAAKLEQSEMEIIEKFCFDVQTRRPETSEDVPFATSAQKAAEIFSMTIDARPKQYGETTYESVKRIFHRIQESDYLDKIYLTDVPEPELKTLDDDLEPEVNVNNEEVTEIITQEQDLNALEEGMDTMNLEGGNMTQSGHEAPIVDNVGLIPQQQQGFNKEHLDLQQQQVALANMPPQAVAAPIMNAPMAPPATAVPSFQPAVATAHSGNTTPVHVAMYHASMAQPTPQQLQQMPNAAALMGAVPTNAAGQLMTGLASQQQTGVTGVNAAQANQQQRQMLNSPAGQPLNMHNANPQQQAPPPGHFNPTPVHAVEQNFFKHPTNHHQQQQQPPQPQQQPQQQQQYLQQIRPLAEVIGSGNFYFLQDSELDSPDLNNQGVQGVPQNTIVFEQQQQQPLQQNKTTQNLLTEQQQTANTPNQQQQQQLQQQLNQQLPPTQQNQQQQQTATQTPIQTQTFTNQSFPQMPPPQQQQQANPNANILQSQTPSPLFQQQQQQKGNQQQLFSPVQTQQQLATPQQQQQLMAEALQQQQPPNSLMMMNRLANANAPSTPLMQQQQQGLLQQQQQQLTPQNQNLVGNMQQQPQQQQQLPTNNSTADMSQTPKNAGFLFENPVVAGLSYEKQMQNKLNAEKVLNALQEANASNNTHHLHKNDLINEWDESVLKASSGTSATNNSQQDFKTTTVEASTNKWSAEVNANSPITVQQTQTRKNEWTATANNSSNNANVNSNSADTSAGGYVNDNRSETNHWHSQDSGSYGRGSSSGNRGQGGGANSGGYQRQRNDDRRDDRRPGGGSGGYRGRSNYGSGNPPQNGQTRGSGGGGGNSSGIYFRNNENATNNSYYQNGSGGGGGGGAGSNVYSNKDSRYDSRSGGGGNYRGPRGSDNNSANSRSNGPPPRHMGNRSTGGGNSNANTNSNSYMNSRQSSNRMPLGIENKN